MQPHSPLRRPRTFRLLAILLGCFPLVMVECGLRWADSAGWVGTSVRHEGFGRSQLFTPVEPSSGEPAVQPAPALRWEITSRWSDYFCHASFADPKPATTRRVFVLGGSTVQGRPYATETAFAKFLELRLNSVQSDWNHEVINCGGVSYASDRIERILNEVLGHDPDAIILYVGHNEFLEDREYDRSTTWIRSIASGSRTIEFIRHSLLGDRRLGDRRLVAEASSNRDWQTRLDREGGMDLYTRDEAWRQRVHEHFEATLTRMVRTCRRHRVPLVVCVPASDWIQTPPFKVEPAPSSMERSTELWQRIVGRDAMAGQFATAGEQSRVESARELLRLDGRHAGAHYFLGRVEYEGDITPETLNDDAREHLSAARDFDVCPLRATSAIEATVRGLSSLKMDSSVMQIVDVPDWLDRPPLMPLVMKDGVVDPGWMVDHVHPTVSGHRRIASGLSEVFEEWGWIEPTAESNDRFRDAAHSHLQSLGENYYHRGQQRLEGLRRWAAGRATVPLSFSEAADEANR